MDKTSWTSSINTLLSGWMALWYNGPSVGEGGPIQTRNHYLFEETREEKDPKFKLYSTLLGLYPDLVEGGGRRREVI